MRGTSLRMVDFNQLLPTPMMTPTKENVTQIEHCAIRFGAQYLSSIRSQSHDKAWADTHKFSACASFTKPAQNNQLANQVVARLKKTKLVKRPFHPLGR